MIAVDSEKCTGCGLCVKICHQHCMTLKDGAVGINRELCSTCTQCIAVCPQQCLSWDMVPPVVYDRTLLPTAEQLAELFRERRSTRFFKKAKIDRTLLGEIIACGTYSPTTNNALRAIAVDDEKIIEELERISIRFYLRLYELFIKPGIVFNILSRITPAVDPKIKAKFEHRRHDLFNPAAMVFVVGDRKIAFSEASAQYALYNMVLYAQVTGIGSCLWGAGRTSLTRSKAARQRLGLRKNEQVLGALLLGYAELKFRNGVRGKTLSTTWISRDNGLAHNQKASCVQSEFAVDLAVDPVNNRKTGHLSSGKTGQMSDAFGRALVYSRARGQMGG